ncbi:MAG: hypothetical protein WD988_03870 [Candidatus Curtissbacteria bacterium]
MGEKSSLSKIFFKVGIAILVVALFDLLYLNYLTFKGGDAKQEARTIDLIPSPAAETSGAPTKGPEMDSTATGATTVNTSQQTVIQNAQKELFIPVGSGSTNSNSYINVPGAQVVIDSANYAGIKNADFEANVWVTGGNGKAYVQLYNVTAGHPVWNSEISTSSGSGVLLVSSPISLDPGENTYQIQAKTDITEFAANVSTGRIKIVLR